MRELLIVGAAGALGSASRYAVTGLVNRLAASAFPWGTLCVNVLGCLLFGVLMQMALAGDLISRDVRLALTTGFLGGFTTFSAFGYETYRGITDGMVGMAAVNVLVSVVLGVLAIWGGTALGRVLVGGA